MRLLLEEYSNKRFSSYVITRENLGITERRLHLRLNEELPVRLQFLREHPNGENESVSVDVVSTDISVGGVKLEVPDDLFKGVDCLGKQVRVAIELPKPLGEVRSLGIIRSVQASESGKKTNVGVEFYGMSPEDSQTLEKFFSWDSKV
ncbi:MAG TPA: PilZ domain-containing protein [Deltaproteobacteria bacterium]|nr:PilZ domain-containing protein [Deltaproteobacteria bacterium]